MRLPTGKSFSVAFVVCIVLLLCSCQKDDDLAYDTTDEWNSCGIGGLFAASVQDGPCDRCRTEAGFIRGGRNGQLCFDPATIGPDERYKRMIFKEVPQSWWPSDTLYLVNDVLWHDSTMSSLAALEVLGYDSEGALWHPPNCTDNRPHDYWGGPIGITGFSTSSDTSFFMEGDRFQFRIVGANINDDCHEDWGYVKGHFTRDTGFAEIIWRPMWGEARNLDTLLISQIYLVDPPAYLPHD